MLKQILTSIALLLVCATSTAQVENYAFKLNGAGSLACGELNKLQNRSNYTLQCWMNPSIWVEGACLFKKGTADNGISLALGSLNQLIYRTGSKHIVINSDKISPNNWSQITVMQSDFNFSVFVNGKLVINELPTFDLGNSEGTFEVGSQFVGRIDEIRFWDTDIDTEYLMYQNTVNNFHPNYANLVAYYKGDQKDCNTKLVDYANDNHGLLNTGVYREKVTDNKLFEYKLLTAYTNITRFFDRKIEKENYLMANDIIILCIETNAKGEAYLATPNNHGKITNGQFLDEYQGRKGILSLLGEGAKIDAGYRALNPTDGWYKNRKQYSMLTWIYLEEWEEGAFLFKKERSNNEGFSVRLGKENANELIVRLNGNDYIWNNSSSTYLKKGEWMHLGISTSTGSATDAVPGREKQLFRVGFNGKSRFANSGPSKVLDSDLSIYEDVPLTIGEGINAKLDQTTVWLRESNSSYMSQEMNEGLGMPSIGGYLDEVYAACATTYYQYDRKEYPGYDSFSTEEFIKIMRSAYEGKTGYMVRLGVSGHSKWENTISYADKREKLATQIKEIVESMDVDGIETDLEWAYNDPAVTNYSKLISLIKDKLPNKIVSSSPHAVAYNLNASTIEKADRFSFQIYTNRAFFTMTGFMTAYDNFLTKYPKNKMVLSYGATTSIGSINGIENGYRSVIEYDPRTDVDDITTPDGNNYLICSVEQVKKRAQFVVDNGVAGLMYWDMGNDLPATNELSLCRAANFVMASNVDKLYSDDDITVGITSPSIFNKEFSIIYSNPVNQYIHCTLPDNERICKVVIYSLDGKIITQESYNNEKSISMFCGNLNKGNYIIHVKSEKGKTYTQNIIK